MIGRRHESKLVRWLWRAVMFGCPITVVLLNLIPRHGNGGTVFGFPFTSAQILNGEFSFTDAENLLASLLLAIGPPIALYLRWGLHVEIYKHRIKGRLVSRFRFVGHKKRNSKRIMGEIQAADQAEAIAKLGAKKINIESVSEVVRHIVCPICRYDLHGTIAASQMTCPECGHIIAVAEGDDS